MRNKRNNHFYLVVFSRYRWEARWGRERKITKNRAVDNNYTGR